MPKDKLPNGAFNMMPNVTKIPDRQQSSCSDQIDVLNEKHAPSNNNYILTMNAEVHGRFIIMGVVGKGGFGQVYYAKDKTTENYVAVKTGQRVRDKDTARFLLEIEIMHMVRSAGCSTMPKIYACGQNLTHQPSYNYLVMELLSKSLSDVRKKTPHNHFSMSTTLRLWKQMLICIRDIHSSGYIHRDIKPANMAMGLGTNNNQLYIIDFGLIRYYLCKTSGNKKRCRPERKSSAFRGTLRYVSARIHARRDACRADDLVALYYSMVELQFERLPWRNEADTQRLYEHKSNFDPKKAYTQLPTILATTYDELVSLEFEHEPRYDLYIEHCEQAMKESNVTESDAWDWDQPNWERLKNENKVKKILTGIAVN